jgi:hypothetical protein
MISIGRTLLFNSALADCDDLQVSLLLVNIGENTTLTLVAGCLLKGFEYDDDEDEGVEELTRDH